MSVIGRLWRRAPAWRLCGTVAVACTALAAMFPPALPQWPARTAGDIAGPAGAAGTPADGAVPAGTAHYIPQPDPAPLNYSTVDRPPLAPGRTGLISQAGHLMPLPAGSWQTLAFAREAGTMAPQVSVLDRMENGLLTGLLIVASPAPVGRSIGPATAPQPCVVPDVLARQVAPQVAGNPYVHECWTIAAATMIGPDGAGRREGLLKVGLERLATLHVTPPDHMLMMCFLRSDEAGWMFATLFLPDRRVTSPGSLHRLEEWAERFGSLFRRGYDRTLVAGDVTPAVVRDPQD